MRIPRVLSDVDLPTGVDLHTIGVDVTDVMGQLVHVQKNAALRQVSGRTDLESQQTVLFGLDHVQRLTVEGDGQPVGVVQIGSHEGDGSIGGYVEHPAIDDLARMTGGGEVDTAETIGREIVRADEFVAVFVVILGRQRVAIGGHPTDGSVVVTRGQEIARVVANTAEGPQPFCSAKILLLLPSQTVTVLRSYST